MKPMTKEEWDKQQSVMRHVYDEESGRTRYVEEPSKKQDCSWQVSWDTVKTSLYMWIGMGLDKRWSHKASDLVAWHGSGGSIGNNWKQMQRGLILYARDGGRAADRSRADFFLHSGERFIPPLLDFCGGKGVWLISHQNSASMSGGLNKAEHERLILCYRTVSSMRQPILDNDMHFFWVISLWYCASRNGTFFYTVF